MPPDGDHRLVRLQDTLAEVLGSQGAVLPPHLPLERNPQGRVGVGGWEGPSEIGLSVHDDVGPLGTLRFGLPWAGFEGLPLVPPWSWTKGRLFDLEIEGTGPFEWTWKNPCGWKGAPSKG